MYNIRADMIWKKKYTTRPFQATCDFDMKYDVITSYFISKSQVLIEAQFSKKKIA